MLPQVADLLNKLQGEREALLKLLGGLSEEEAEVHPGNEWSAKQQISHVLGDELTWLSDALAVHKEPGAVVGHPPEAALSFFRGVAEADSKPLEWWLHQLRETRSQTLRHIQKMDLSTPEAVERQGSHISLGEMTLLQMLRAIYRHDRMHLEQVQGKETSFASRPAPDPAGQS